MYELYQELGKSFEFKEILSRKPAIIVNLKEVVDNITCDDCWFEDFETIEGYISDLNWNCSFDLATTETELSYITEELNQSSIPTISKEESIALENLLKQVQSLPLLKQ